MSLHFMKHTQKDLIEDSSMIRDILNKKLLVYRQSLISVANVEGVHWEHLPSIVW